MADACAQARPDWDGLPISAFSEAITLFTSPLGIVLILATAIAIRIRSQWGGLVIVLGWTSYVTLITMLDPTGLRDLAQVEGCVGSPTLFILCVTAICGGIIIYTAPRKTRL